MSTTRDGSASSTPTNVRWLVLGVTTLTSFMLYLDRACMATILSADSFKSEITLTPAQDADIKSWFFWAYALCQVPAGFLADKFGARGIMAFYVIAWSTCTLLGGFANGFVGLAAARVGLAIVQAGAYPTSVGLLGNWIPFQIRGVASSIVATGGRFGGASAPLLTAWLVVGWGWREALILYGIVGIAIGILFYVYFRTSPERHPKCNQAECDLITDGRPPAELRARSMRSPMPWGPLVKSFGMWMNCLVQFATNVGWAFIISDLPKYLREVHKLSDIEAGGISTFAFLCGIPGMLFGGWLTDYATRKLGLRWGRAVPTAAARFVAMLAYVACLFLDDPYLIAGAIGLMAFATDLGVGGIWAYTQDVGGRYAGSMLGWGNMWGNFGAALQPKIVQKLLHDHGNIEGWNYIFIVFIIAFAISSVAALALDGTKPVVPKSQE